jgi:uncharacterized membrane protein YfcA
VSRALPTPVQYSSMSYLVICSVACAASMLTFFSGFGLGTLLLPAFALFVPVEQAVALTAVVHLLNSMFKLLLVGRHADASVALRFGLPAIAAAFAGAWLLQRLAHGRPLLEGEVFGLTIEVAPLKLLMGLLLLGFAVVEVVPRLRDLSFPPRFLPLGGLASGFLGGLSGMQGALRSAFLVRAGLSKESFIATGVVIACVVDLSRLAVYAASLPEASTAADLPLLAAAVAAAFAGAVLGNRWLKKMTLVAVQRVVAGMVALVAIGMIVGVV